MRLFYQQISPPAAARTQAEAYPCSLWARTAAAGLRSVLHCRQGQTLRKKKVSWEAKMPVNMMPINKGCG
jgi:hypothetical protein